ncbi:uncharacterized protein LOC121242341 [Juglans microcarpa x Juglans regia]|uniref:uncharacterized protein LOC121242341 n=1 Tax=Juglans microcarpa x Juglans regia TaxID=2249226 RepID=UPI001B7DDED5|nr:uncharacterized protein LOC121242341 [Juglans microcarpa x Juglans regia]
MRLLSWNCRGLGNPRTVRDLSMLVKIHKPSILFLMETKLQKKNLDGLKLKLGFKYLFSVDSVGRSGGMVLLWAEDVHIKISTYSQKHINMWVVQSEVEWMLTCFYGNPKTEKRYEGWGILRHLNRLQPKRWLCLGDFNEILYHSEKYGGARREEKQIADFRSVLQDCQLKDLGCIQGKYTWSNLRKDYNFTKERLDRVTTNSEWCAAFGGGDVKVLASYSSDHCPILMAVGQQNVWTEKPAQLCRYEDSWSLFSDCEEVITHTWHRYGRNKEGLSKINTKLEGCLQKNKRNSITKIIDENGRTISNSKHIGEAFTQYFKELLATSNPINLDNSMHPVKRKVSQQMNEALLAPFRKEEIEDVVFQMGPHKAPGPNGGMELVFIRNTGL